MCFAHKSHLIDCLRIDSAFTAPVKVEFVVDDPIANVLNTITFQQKVIICKIIER